MNYKKVTKYVGLIFFGVIIFLLSISYMIAPVYEFSPPKPFSGKLYYNPYRQTNGLWILANFHAHSRSWGGLTNGKDTHVDSIVKVYKEMGYSHIGISNYQKITYMENEGITSIPTYEHGYNIKKRHHLCLGTDKVTWLDFVFWQTLSNKQFMLNYMRNSSNFLAINHPKFSGGFEESDFAALSNYDAVEVLNHYRTSIPHWDSALSSGYYAVLLANDDMHDLSNPGETGSNITVVNTNSTDRYDIIEALKAGRHYGVKVKIKPDENLSIKRERNANLLHPKSIDMQGDTLNVVFDGQVAEIRFTGQNGTVRKITKEQDSAWYVFDNDDTYLRIEADDREGNLYLFNPVVRTDDGYPARANRWSLNVWQTGIKWVIIFVEIVFTALYFYRRRKRRLNA